MEPSIYVGLSGQLALQRRLDTIANNVANSGTAGFRSENVTFESVLSQGAVAYSGVGKEAFSFKSGNVTQTDNPFDVAIQGNAFLAISTPGGNVYTRDGRMRISATGDLETLEGHRVLDPGGAPIQINAARGPIQIGLNGAISQDGNRVASLGLFRLPSDARLTRGPGNGLVSDKAGEAVTDFNTASAVQGYVEAANVNPVHEMTRLISVSRAFEALSASIERSDRQLTDAIRALAGNR
jgi:flagellar basal-body rod protein FlgF